MKTRMALLLAVPTLALGACGGDSDEDKIKDIINDGSENAVSICENATDKLIKEQLGGTRESCEKQAEEAEKGDKDGDVKDLKVEVDGDKASANFTDNDGDANKVSFVKEDGDWKIDKIG